MRLLLDTHVFLWFILNDPRLPNPARDLIQNPSNEVLLSPVSIWEVCIKYQLGKISLPGRPAEYLTSQRSAHLIETLDLTESCLFHLQDLPPLHKDPFDRILICQAIESQCLLMTDDAAILAYTVSTLPLQ